jgi:hypothetical protein
MMCMKYYQPLPEDPRCEPLDCREPLDDLERGSSLLHLGMSAMFLIQVMG